MRFVIPLVMSMLVGLSAQAQINYTVVGFNASAEAAVSQGVDPFDDDSQDDSAERMTQGRFDRILTANASVGGGSADGMASFVSAATPERIEAIAELSASARQANVDDDASGAAAFGLGAAFTVNQEIAVAVSASAEVMRRPGAVIGAEDSLINISLLGIDPTSPTGGVVLTIDINTFGNPGGETSGEFFEVVTLRPGIFYSLTVNGGVFANATPDTTSSGGPITAKVNFLLTTNDEDEDGLIDEWESDGIDVDADGTFDIILPGANPMRKNLYVEVDTQSGSSIPSGQLNKVVQAFANSPVPNPDGSQGIDLRFDLDESSLPALQYTANDITGTTNLISLLTAQREAHFGTPAQRSDEKSDLLLEARRNTHRYLVYGGSYQITDRDSQGNTFTYFSSGFGEIPGDDFVVTPTGLRSFSGDDPARTIMHELGHNLGLRHGGGDDINFKPNYFSVMNYQFQKQINGQPTFNATLAIDYSRDALPALNETSLDEQFGVGSSDPSTIGRLFLFYNPQSPTAFKFFGDGSPGATVDWNRDGDDMDTGISLDINNIPNNPGSNASQTLNGHDDWANLMLPLRGSNNFGRGAVGLADTTLSTGEYSTLDEDSIEQGLPPEEAPCVADINGDGVVTGVDFTDFIIAFSAANPVADINGDGVITGVDFTDFIIAFGVGCP